MLRKHMSQQSVTWLAHVSRLISLAESAVESGERQSPSSWRASACLLHRLRSDHIDMLRAEQEANILHPLRAQLRQPSRRDAPPQCPVTALNQQHQRARQRAPVSAFPRGGWLRALPVRAAACARWTCAQPFFALQCACQLHHAAARLCEINKGAQLQVTRCNAHRKYRA